MKTNTNIASYPATTTVVPLQLAKDNSNIDYADKDDLLNSYLNAAVQDAEEYTGIIIQARAATIKFSAWEKSMFFSANPMTAITSLKYVDVDGAEQTLVEDDDFELVSGQNGLSQCLYIKLADFPELQDENPFPITLIGTVGYGASTVPPAVQRSILLKFGHNEMYREDMAGIRGDRSFFAALRPFKKW